MKKNYLFYQNAIGCYDRGTNAAKAIVCAGLNYLSHRGFMKAFYQTILGPCIQTDDALYKPAHGYTQKQVIQMLRDYVVRSKAPVLWR